MLGLAIWVGVWMACILCWGARAIPRGPSPRGPSVGIAVKSSDYKPPGYCGDCHYKLWQQWTGTMHSFAATDPVYVSLYVLADQQTGGKAEEFCAASLCHAPVGRLAGEIPPVDGSRLSPIALNGVFCDFCHTVKSAKGVGNGKYAVDPGPVKRGPYADAVSPAHQTAYSPLHRSARFCGMCHNVTHPKYGTKLETTYDEWAAGPYASGKGAPKRVCQDCHMAPQAPKKYGPQRGKAALAGPTRPNIYSHDIVGANVFIPRRLGDTSTVARAKALLKSAARLSVALGAPAGGAVPVSVRVTNVGAGHYLPTGVTELRQMWVELSVRDRDGVVRYTNGALDTFNEVPKDARVFHMTVADEKGEPTEYVWFARKVLSDDRIAPKGSKTVRFRVPLAGGRRPARVTARLLYRSMPQHIADIAFGKGKERVPYVEMARANAIVR